MITKSQIALSKLLEKESIRVSEHVDFLTIHEVQVFHNQHK